MQNVIFVADLFCPIDLYEDRIFHEDQTILWFYPSERVTIEATIALVAKEIENQKKPFSIAAHGLGCMIALKAIETGLMCSRLLEKIVLLSPYNSPLFFINPREYRKIGWKAFTKKAEPVYMGGPLSQWLDPDMCNDKVLTSEHASTLRQLMLKPIRVDYERVAYMVFANRDPWNYPVSLLHCGTAKLRGHSEKVARRLTKVRMPPEQTSSTAGHYTCLRELRSEAFKSMCSLVTA